jgi:hypothetical protein
MTNAASATCAAGDDSIAARREDGNDEALPTHVRTPEGEEMPLFGEALAAEVGRRPVSSTRGEILDKRVIRGTRNFRRLRDAV